MVENLEKLMTKIELEKEILSALPINTKKNKEAYTSKVEELKTEYERYKKEILEKMKQKYNEETQKEEETNIIELQNKLNQIENDLNIINDTKNVYEKMGLDKEIYHLKRFYKKNLKTVNGLIINIIKLFEKVGITLDYRDFNFTEYTKQYMEKFFKELKEGAFEQNVMKEEFEKIYWKSPDIITHLQLNFRYLFLKKEKEIIKYYKEQEEKVKKTIEENVNNIEENYTMLKKQYIEENKMQKSVIINKFLNGELNIKDYEERTISKTYSRFIQIEMLEEKKEEVNNNLMKLLHNLYEYRNYLKYKFIFDNIKKIYSSENQTKTTYNSIKKQIIDRGDKLNSSSTIKKLKAKKDETIIQEIEGLCEELDKIEVIEKIKEKVKEDSTIKEMGKVISGFYKYLFVSMIENNKEIEEQEILNQIQEFEDFIDFPYNTISESIILMEEKEIPLIIKDRYSLFDIKITKEQLDENGIDVLIKDLEKIENYYYIQKTNINLEKIDALCRIKKIILDKK